MDTHSRLNRIYRGLKTRCNNLHNHAYSYYGARGITICSEWADSSRVNTGKALVTQGWLAFKKWAEENGYTPDLTLDRIDNSKGYSPDNCRWVTRKVQANNRSSNHLISYKGKTQSIATWGRELGIDEKLISCRLLRGWSVKRALEEN